MKIRELTREYSVNVYAIYWVDGIRYHLVIPYHDYGGLLVVSENECELVDPWIDEFIMRKSGSGSDILVHWAAEKGALIDRLTDGPDPEAVAELHRRIREDKPSI